MFFMKLWNDVFLGKELSLSDQQRGALGRPAQSDCFGS